MSDYENRLLKSLLTPCAQSLHIIVVLYNGTLCNKYFDMSSSILEG